ELRAANHGVRSTVYGLPKIADFGLAKLLVEDSGHTEHGDVLGTANYMAPEQAAGHVDLIGPATDIYSLGVVLYELLTGRVPLQGTTTLETLALVRGEEPVSPRRLQPQIPRDLETICLKCLEKEPAARYASAAALADDLHNFLHHVPIRARPITFWERVWKWAKRRPAVAALSVALALVALAAVAAVTWQWQRAEEKAAGELRARRAAENNQKQVERLSVSMMLDQAAGLCESGEVASGLLWMAQALETSERIGAPDLEHVARLNLAGWRPFLVRKRAEVSQGVGVATAAFSPSGDSLVTAGSDGEARLWDVATGTAAAKALTLNGPVNSVAYDRGGRRILAGSGENESGETRLWNAASGELLGPPLAHARAVTVVAFAGQEGERFVTVSPDEARLWRTADRQPIGSPMTHGPVFQGEATAGKPQPMTAVVSPDGRLIATGGCDKMVRLWNAAAAEPAGEPLLATHPVVVLAFSPDSKTLLAGSLDGGVRMWDVATGQRRGESLRLRGDVYVVAFSPDAQIAAAAGAVGYEDREPSGEVQLCQVETGQNLGGALAHPRPVRALAFSPRGRLLLTGCDDGQARLFVTATGAPVGKHLPHDAPLTVVAFRPDGKIALTASAQSNRACLKLWHAPDERAFGRPLVQPGELAGVQFGDDGTTLTTTTRDGGARQWDLETGTSQVLPFPPGQPEARPPGGESNVEPVAVSPDGSLTLAAGSDGVARLRDTATDKTLGPPIGRDGVRAVAYSANPPRLAAAGSDGKIVVWDAWLPLGGSAERVKLSIEWLTGLELVLHETIRPLSEDRLRACRQRLDELGGPLLVDDP
ncbi:MAG TPA: protein kinase, partial [Pirellulales bacterium]|nr:protein kinase [Pirellulales bacterium]